MTTEKSTPAGTFTLETNNNPSFSFDTVTAFDTAGEISISGERDAWGEEIKSMEWVLANTITSGAYNESSPEVKRVYVVSDLAGLKYKVETLKLNINADHSSRHILGLYEFVAKQTDSSGPDKDLLGKGRFEINYT
ncbi:MULTISPECIES: hypothetical protein [Pseudomonas]|uniref:hypothetical protein n=1 Tax=Pseudomonas TaxID=286 RepID=UPI0002700D5C|nr:MULTISPECIES: hypothetical protein [Pseudomonas]EJM26170.1 hypothetical protein PMI24_03820 [Pseudomonas sp. GM25]MCU0089781.1 hypothetical protein [Pseudomonas koreensis]